jgi:hypothetical protein
VVENPEEIPDEDGDVREERNKIAAIMANRWEFPFKGWLTRRQCCQRIRIQHFNNPDPAPDPGF